MKKRLLILILASQALTQINANEKLYDAINNVNVNRVKYELDREVITALDKEKLLESANNSIDLCKNNTRWLVKSFKDVLKVLTGFGLFGTGSTVAAIGLLVALKNSNSNNGLFFAAIGGGIGIGGIYLINSGWSMTSAKSKLNKAMQIKRLIQDVQVQS